MKALGIIIIIFATLFAVAAFIEKYHSNKEVSFYAEGAKDLFGIIFCMLSIWFLYCVLF